MFSAEEAERVPADGTNRTGWTRNGTQNENVL
jgi:hypothetical protein